MTEPGSQPRRPMERTAKPVPGPSGHGQLFAIQIDLSIDLVMKGFDDRPDLSLEVRKVGLQAQPVFHRGFTRQAGQTAMAPPAEENGEEVHCPMAALEFAFDSCPA